MHFLTRRLPSLTASVLFASFSACGGSSGTAPTEPDAPVVTSVTISPSIAMLDAVGATAQFTARVRDQQGREMTGVSVSWLSSDPSVATISSTGLATALENGSTTIIAVATESVSGWATMNVEVVNLLITSGNLEAAILGQPYSQTLTAEGSNDPVWSISEGALPEGLSLDGAAGVISGTPTTIGVNTFTVLLTSGNQTTSRAMSITVISGSFGIGFGADQFALIEAGSFQMGSTSGDPDEQPVHQVNITQPFYIQKTEVTQGQWIEIMGSNPAGFSTCGQTCPVERVSWDMVQSFLIALNAQHPGENFRLPTEAEWEYAARAETTGDYSGTEVLTEMGWYFGNSQSKTHFVALKEPNAWGLFDVHGNAEEWVQDFYSSTYYGESPTDDPQGPGAGENRVLRGGSVTRGAEDVSSAARSSGRPSNRGFTVYLGLRLAKNPS